VTRRSSASKARPASRLARDEAGFTLVEVLVALVLLSVISSGVAYGLIQSSRITGDSRTRVVAANVAAQEIDRVRAVADPLTIETMSFDTTLNGQDFHVLRSATWEGRDPSGSPCDGGNSRFLAYKTISVRVTWDYMNGTKPVRSETVITPSVDSLDPSLSSIAVKILGNQSQGVETAFVRLTGPTTDDQYSDEHGCVFFTQLQSGTYTLTAEKAGHVDTARATVATSQVTTSPGQTTAVQFDYDEATALDVTLPTGTYPAPASVPVTIGNSGLQPRGTLTVTGSGTTRAIDSLFPFAGGYQVWAGACGDADPEGTVRTPEGNPGAPYHDGGTREAPVSAEPGQRAAATVVMAQIDVLVTDDEGDPLVGYPVTAVHDPDPDTCTAGETYDLGATDSSGYVRASLPFGTWRLQATLPGGPREDLEVLAPNTGATALSRIVDPD
jgi:prepilin-type N-terminal cleavage/methylation domain-containing protein